jgi:uncharacterized protein (TIGR01777 family)
MRVLIAGSSGLIGRAVGKRFLDSGHDVHRLVRREVRSPGEHSWDPPAGRIDEGAFDGVDAVINLCGAPLFPARWSAARKQVLVDSRVEPTEVLAEAVVDHAIPTLVNASAVGYYGDAGSSRIDETAPGGSGFLAELCGAWEAATKPASSAGARVVNLRTGLVLSREGGLLGTLRPLFSLALGGRLGDGKQYMPWIALADEAAAVQFAVEHASMAGPANLTAPEPVTNAEFTSALARAVHRPAPWWVPGMGLKIALGQLGEEMALYGQRAVPRSLLSAGFEFATPDLAAALRDAV